MAVRSFYLPMVFPSQPLTELQARSRADALLYRVRSQDLSNQLPSGLARTSRALVDDPEIRRFSSLLEVGFQPDAKQLAKAGDQPDPTQNPEIFALAQSGARTLTVLGRLLDQAVQEAVATAQADRHRTSLRAAETVALAVVLLVVTVNTLVMIGGALSRRLRELAVGAQLLRAGHLANVSVKGPRELAAASGAINDAVLNLRAVQVKAEILASGDFSAPELEEPAPGPLGRAVHASVARIVSTAREREELRQRLAYEATHDALTGLVNRAEVHKALQSALDRARFTGLSVSVIFIDLDRFKACNDRFGHAAGDHVLRTVSASLLAQIREQDTAGRLGGDEFVLIIESLPIGAELLRLGNRLVQVLSEPVAYENQLIGIGASIGIASDTGGTTDADELIRQADLAAYRAKAVGGGTVEVHAPVLSSHAESR
jgi:diguanylate cyclase (GGDEF)-like protein